MSTRDVPHVPKKYVKVILEGSDEKGKSSLGHRRDAVFFNLQKGVIMKSRIVYCPICGKKTGTYSGMTEDVHVSRCRKCNKRVIYNPLTGETICKRFPEKNTSSGVSFV